MLKLSKGKILTNIVGEERMQAFYQKLKKDPERLANLLRRENSKSILFFDYDSFIDEDNTENVNLIKKVVECMDIPIQYVTRIPTISYAEHLLDCGIQRIFVDDILLKETGKLKQLVEKYTPSKVCTYFFFRDGELIPTDRNSCIRVDGWIKLAKKAGINRMLFAEKAILERGENYDFDYMFNFAKKHQMKVTMIEGVHNSELLRKYNSTFPPYIDSVALGKSLFENTFPCQKMWRMVEAELEGQENVITTAGELTRDIMKCRFDEQVVEK
jgi:phosphoribosylformimino-5-aminoimidazole carboxamide ribotide isomerase